MSFRCGIFFIIFAVLSCVKKPPQTSNAASIVIGEVSQDKVAHDGFKVSIKRGGTSQDYGNPAELTAAKFSAGDNIILAMQLSKAGKIVAESKTGSEKCSPVMLTLIAGGNPIKVPLCLTNGINSDPVVVNPPSESGAAVSAQPCIVGAENCNPTDPLTDYKKLDMIDYLRQHTSQVFKILRLRCQRSRQGFLQKAQESKMQMAPIARYTTFGSKRSQFLMTINSSFM
ncbi:MAG: hypothetical protein NTV34_12380 [Proteobacteria bacterium]|nr:hypothetical protein [Pseudomonadota bacterium]